MTESQTQFTLHLLGRAFRYKRRLYALVVFVLALVQFTKLDRSVLGFAIFQALPPVIALIVSWHPRTTRPARYLADAILTLMALGTFVATHPDFLPILSRPSTNVGNPFWQQWNQLPVSSRRIIGWNMGVNGYAIFAVIAYLVFIKELQRQAQGYQPGLSRGLCIVGLVGIGTLLLMVTVTLLGLAMGF